MPFTAPRRCWRETRSASAGHADDGLDALALLAARERDEVLEELVHGLLVLRGALLDEAALERAVEVEHGPRLQRLGAEQDRLLHDLPRDHVERPAHVALHHVLRAVRRRDRAARGPEVDADVEDVFLRGHVSSVSRGDDCGIPRTRGSRPRERARSSAGSAASLRRRASSSLETVETSARMPGISVAMRTTNGASFTPWSSRRGHGRLQARDEPALHGLGEPSRLAGARVLEDALEEAPVVRERVARLAVLVARERLDARVRRRAEDVRLDDALVAHRRERVHVDRDEEVGPLRVREKDAVPEGQRRVAVARHRDGEVALLEDRLDPGRDVERDVLFPHARADGAGVRPAVPRVEDDGTHREVEERRLEALRGVQDGRGGAPAPRPASRR